SFISSSAMSMTPDQRANHAPSVPRPQQAPYFRPADLPTFAGKQFESIFAYLRSFADLAKSKRLQMDEMLGFVPLSLAEQAKSWYYQCPEFHTWEEFRLSFLATYRSAEIRHGLEEALRARRLTDFRSLDDYLVFVDNASQELELSPHHKASA